LLLRYRQLLLFLLDERRFLQRLLFHRHHRLRFRQVRDLHRQDFLDQKLLIHLVHLVDLMILQFLRHHHQNLLVHLELLLDFHNHHRNHHL
tara:strand:- start:362 stop:634 length:273 start_codon:yes stop_codon:yes gene_type:complete